MLAGVEAERTLRPVPRLLLPRSRPVRPDPLTAAGPVQVVRLTRWFSGVERGRRPGHRSVVLGLNCAGTDDAAAVAGLTGYARTPEKSRQYTALALGYDAHDHETLEPSERFLSHMPRQLRTLPNRQQRHGFSLFLFSGDDVEKPRACFRRRTAEACLLFLLYRVQTPVARHPTNNPLPASREEVLGALRSFRRCDSACDPLMKVRV